MAEFNEDGSIKLPAAIQKMKMETEERLQKRRCIHVKKEMVSFTSPKRCMLHLRLSEAITQNTFVETIYGEFNKNSSVPSKIVRLHEKEFDIEIGTHFKRCSDCTNLIRRFKEFLDVIEEKGTCTYEGFKMNFCYEDYFD